MKPHCQCREGCDFLAEPGEPYALTHDPRPERAEARQALLAARGKAGARKMHAARQALSEAKAATLSVRTVDGQLNALDVALRDVMVAKLDAAKRAQAVAQIVKAARDVLATGEVADENRELKALLVERHPELRKQLRVVP